MNLENPNKKRKALPKMKGQVGESRAKIIEKHYDWGLYVYKKANGKWFTDGTGSVLNIPSMKGDITKISELKKAAKYYGDEGDGECIFVPGLIRISEEEYSEQKQRMAEGLIPSMNDLGAVQAAKDTIAKYGSDD
jgi:ABC-type xylose transport system substrate-binding protein